MYGPPKSGRARTVDISASTVGLLRAHRRAQNELKLKNRAHWADHGLVFCKEAADLTGAAGEYAAEWFDVTHGASTPGPTVRGGGRTTFTTPFPGPAALHLRRTNR